MKSVLAALLCLGLAAEAGGRQIGGVELADTVTVEGKTLKLSGGGIRTRAIFKVYVAGLYLETPAGDAAAVASSDQVKRMQLVLLRGLDKGKITEAIMEGFEKNSKAQMPALKARLDRFNAMIPDLEKGDQIVLTYAPGKGTEVAAKGAAKGTIEGKDFADALFSVWLGPNPVQEDLKKALLGG
ncbi:MAG: chalcone isomerase family protein [Thermoanaerobaculia bacterium]